MNAYFDHFAALVGFREIDGLGNLRRVRMSSPVGL
jgi:hypothetical protein